MKNKNSILKLLSIVLALILTVGVMMISAACPVDDPPLTEYTITYDLAGEGAVNNPNNPEKYTLNELPLSIKAPTREGYIFTGWTSERNITKELEVKLTLSTQQDLNFKANWVEDILAPGEYRIQFNSNISGATEYTVNGDSFPSPEKYNNGDLFIYTAEELPITITVGTKTKYEFVNWTKLVNSEVIVAGTDRELVIAAGGEINGTLTCNWREVEPAGYSVGKVKAPDFELKDTKGNTVKLSDYYGKKPVFISFWQYT